MLGLMWLGAGGEGGFLQSTVAQSPVAANAMVLAGRNKLAHCRKSMKKHDNPRITTQVPSIGARSMPSEYLSIAACSAQFRVRRW